MALTLPTSDQLLLFWGSDAVTTDPERIDAMIQIAADLLFLATGLTKDPVDPVWYRLEQIAIADMAIYLLVDRDSLSENYSDMSGEHIGSYSYSKAAAAAANSGTAVGATLYMAFVNAWNAGGSPNGTATPVPLATTELVFTPGVYTLTLDEQLIHATPAWYEFGWLGGAESLYAHVPGISQ